MKLLLAKLWRALNLPKGIQLTIMNIFQDKFLIGVTGIIFNKKREILLFKHSYRSHSWSLPGGYLKSGEHPQRGNREVNPRRAGVGRQCRRPAQNAHRPRYGHPRHVLHGSTNRWRISFAHQVA